MLKALRDIAVFIDNSAEGEAIARHAAQLAKAHDAHLIGIYGLERAGSEGNPGSYARGRAAISQMLELQREAEAQKILIAGRKFAELTEQDCLSSEFRVVWRDSLDDHKVLRGLHCDLLVAADPKPIGLPSGWTADALMRMTGTPVLLIPTGWSGGRIGQHVMIAWNRSREARRVVGDAMPFLHQAGRISIVTVDADRKPDHYGENPGENLLGHLSRHDITAEIINIASNGQTVPERLLTEADKQGADLLVAGASGHSRPSTFFFGSTTRSLIAGTRIPIVISG